MIVLLVGLIGLCIGSFLNVLIDRLPKGETVTWDRSRCDHCGKALRWFELVPVISFIFLGGKCLRCKKKLKIQYPAIELVTALGFIGIWNAYGISPFAFLGLLLVYCAFVVTLIIDFRHQIIPDSMTLLAGFGAALWVWQTVPTARWAHHGIAALLASGFLYIVWAATRGKGMGFGDVKFAIVMGILLGLPNTVVALYAGFLTGALVGVILIMKKAKTLKSKIAFGPFLIIGTVIAFIWGSQIYGWWKNLL